MVSMLLREDVQYVVLDFETTGTDKKHDEIIQIGITQFDVTGQIVREFSSYVKPLHAEKLHDIIDMITGISIDMLENAPSWADIHDTVASFFTEKTVIIGHSIAFDIAFLQRYGTYAYYTSIDTFPLAQALYPYLPSYALEIIAHHILGDKATHTEGFHDALIDCRMTGQVFFQLLKTLEKTLYEQPYLREICKRCNEGLPICIHYSDNRYLLAETPVLSTPTPFEKKSKDVIDLPMGVRYAGDTLLDELAIITTQNHMVSAFSHHPKVLLTQKRLVQQNIMLNIHEQHIFDTHILHAFLTKKNYIQRERHCATKYFIHISGKHKSYHTLSHHDRLFVQVMQSTTGRSASKKLYTHQEIFSHVEQLTLPPETHIVMYDKDWLYDSFRKRRYNAVDLYHVADLLEAFSYKHTLLGHKHDIIDNFLASWYIFLGQLTHEVHMCVSDFTYSKKASHDSTPTGGKNTQPQNTTPDNIRIDNYETNSYFYKSQKIRSHLVEKKNFLEKELDTHDLILFERAFETIAGILKNPCTMNCKRGQFMQWITLQKVDTFVSRNDITDFFQGYSVTFLSLLDKKYKPLPLLSEHNKLLSEDNKPSHIHRKQIIKRKDVIVQDKPKICIIAPSKQAANQLVMSLHKSNVYKDTLLAAENITGGAGKIIQQALQKQSYILIGGYGFCLQCIAHGLEFDSMCALDIMQGNSINTFMDIEYYATKKT